MPIFLLQIFVSNLRDYLLEPKALKDYVQRLMSANGINIEKVALIREEKLHQYVVARCFFCCLL